MEKVDYNRLVQNLSSGDSDVRRRAVYDLEQFETKDVVEHLIRSLQDEHRAVREATAEVLENIAAGEVVARLVTLLGSRKIEVRNLVASILVRYGEPVVATLQKALFDADEDVRKFAADILGLIGSPQAVEPLCRVIDRDPVDNVVVAAIEALGKIASEKALGQLYQIYKKRTPFRAETAEAIGLIGTLESARFLEEHLDQEDPLVCFAVIEALGNVGQVRSLKMLRKMLRNAPQHLQTQLCYSILKIAQRLQIGVLAELVTGSGDAVLEMIRDRREESEGLVNFQLSCDLEKAALDFLVENQMALTPGTVIMLIRCLSGREELHPVFHALVEHEDEGVVYAALDALASFGDEQIIPLLKKVLESEREMAVASAIPLILEKKLQTLLPMLRTLSESENPDLQFMASNAVAQLDRI